MISALGGAAGKPAVSIGLPVYNGANFLAEAIESILAQDFRDFELIIADNASTDDTPEICRRYAEQDPRIKVVRHPRNIGAAKNYNYVFHCASGEYFKWAAHDDVMGPGFLSTCLEGFARQGPAAVLVYPEFDYVDRDLAPMAVRSSCVHTTAADPIARLREAYAGLGMVASIFGLFRRSALVQTQLIGSYLGSDYALVIECALLGQIVRLGGGVQFSRRLHDEGSCAANETNAERMAWFDPDTPLRRGVRSDAPVRPGHTWLLKLEYLRSLMTMPGLTRWQRVRGAAFLARRSLGYEYWALKQRLKHRLRLAAVSVGGAAIGPAREKIPENSKDIP